MDIEAIKNSPIGDLVPIAGFDRATGGEYRHFAFVPSALPKSFPLSASTWTLVAQAEAGLARLDEAARHFPGDPALLRRPALRREAHSTSAIEGTYAPLADVLERDVDERAQLSLELREILNYVVAAEEAFAWVAERPLTAGFIGQLQYTLVQGTEAEHSDAGGVRDRQVAIGPRDAPVTEARFVPPPPGDQLRAGFEEWVAWVNEPPLDLPPVARAAAAHYQFETLHPFSDGNGRIGRLLIVLQLLRDRALTEPLLVISPWLESRRAEYQDGLLALSRTGDWDRWVNFFASAVAGAADATRARIDRLMQWRAGALAQARAARISGVAERVAGELIAEPVLTAGRVARRHGVTHQAGMDALRRLAGVGLLRELDRRGRKTFVASAVVDLLR